MKVTREIIQTTRRIATELAEIRGIRILGVPEVSTWWSHNQSSAAVFFIRNRVRKDRNLTITYFSICKKKRKIVTITKYLKLEFSQKRYYKIFIIRQFENNFQINT